MAQINIIPASADTFENLSVFIGKPPFIVAEGLQVAYYAAQGSGAVPYSIRVSTCPVRSDYLTLDVESKSVGTYRKPPRNNFNKKGAVILRGSDGIDIDFAGVFYPAAVYNTKEKKFMVYYLGQRGGLYSICLASGKEYNNLTKWGSVAGKATAVVANPAGWVVTMSPIYAEYNKEEDLYKLWYECVDSPGGTVFSSWLSTSRDGYNFV